jgi:hypothetical protein
MSPTQKMQLWLQWQGDHPIWWLDDELTDLANEEYERILQL